MVHLFSAHLINRDALNATGEHKIITVGTVADSMESAFAKIHEYYDGSPWTVFQIRESRLPILD